MTTEHHHRYVWGVLLDNEYNMFGRKGGIVAICETEDDAKQLIEHIKSNPYFHGECVITPFRIGHDYSSWSEYQKARKSK